MQQVVTRFAPSPSGFLHIGGARTALFNKLFAKHFGGLFLLRIEDTDRKRTFNEAIDGILQDLSWLGLDWDQDPVYQSQNIARHKEVALKLLKEGYAYRCFSSSEELAELKQKQISLGLPLRYDGRWRDKKAEDEPKNTKYVIRLKAPQEGETIIDDIVQGKITTKNTELDDMILLRSDGTPTYMLSAVIDDHDMGITHVIRGDDHLTNAFRQLLIFKALDWVPPTYGHIPLIHGPDGAKLSKRHGAIGADKFRSMGFLPIAIRNYLLRLGWAHGNEEIISDKQAIEWFNGTGIGKSPSRFDLDKMSSLNSYYIKNMKNTDLVDLIIPILLSSETSSINNKVRKKLIQGMDSLKERSKNLVELAENSKVYLPSESLQYSEKAKNIIISEGIKTLELILPNLEKIKHWNSESLEEWARSYAKNKDIKLGQLAQPLRASLTGSTQSPPIFEVMEIFGQKDVIDRIKKCIETFKFNEIE